MEEQRSFTITHQNHIVLERENNVTCVFPLYLEVSVNYGQLGQSCQEYF